MTNICLCEAVIVLEAIDKQNVRATLPATVASLRTASPGECRLVLARHDRLALISAAQSIGTPGGLLPIAQRIASASRGINQAGFDVYAAAEAALYQGTCEAHRTFEVVRADSLSSVGAGALRQARAELDTGALDGGPMPTPRYAVFSTAVFFIALDHDSQAADIGNPPVVALVFRLISVRPAIPQVQS